MAKSRTTHTPKLPGKQKLIFRAWRVDPVTGERLWAKNFGLRAWPIWVDDNPVK
jgi:hypothetical protein